MNRKRRMAELMEAARQAHAEHQRVWLETRTALVPMDGIFGPEVLRANHHAYNVAQPHADRRDRALAQLSEELPPVEQFLSGDPAALDAVLDFLEVDVPAFRCGYVKEWLLTRLKRVPLRDRHARRLRALTLALCERPHYRRELPYLGRLMIRLADAELVERLRELEQSPRGVVRYKAAILMSQILNGRKDLRGPGGTG